MYEDNRLESVFSKLHIPDDLLLSYQRLLSPKGGKSDILLFDWQRECLYNTNVLRGENLVYCVPTGGGKTLIAELVLWKTVIAMRKQAIYVMPYVSLVQEKERQLKIMLRSLNRQKNRSERIRVKGYYGGVLQKDRMKRMYGEQIILCTVERANIIFNNVLMELKSSGSDKKKNATFVPIGIGCVVLDELHVLGNTFNGYLLEILIR